MEEVALRIGILVAGALLIAISWRSEGRVRSVTRRIRSVAVHPRRSGHAVTTYRVARKGDSADRDE
jgi:hypothetical protein